MIIYVIGLITFQCFFLSGIIKIISIFLNILYLISALLTYLLNPGTIFKWEYSNERTYCKECKYLYPYHKKLKHCYTCCVCVIQVDHHCGVFGKCIARNNIIWFFTFITSTFISIFSCVGTLVSFMVKMPI